jgi:hypothetical protein
MTVMRWTAHGLDTMLPIAWVRCLRCVDATTIADRIAGSVVVEAAACRTE